MRIGMIVAVLLVLMPYGGIEAAQSDATISPGTHERIEVYGPSLEGNLEGDSPTRLVSVYLASELHH